MQKANASTAALVAVIITLMTSTPAHADQSKEKSIFDSFYIPAPHCLTVLGGMVRGAEDATAEPLSLRFIPVPEDHFLQSVSDKLSTVEEWKAWNNSATNKLNDNFSKLPERIDAHGKIALAKVKFTIARDGKMRGISVTNLTEDPKFTAMITKAVKSLEGDPSLEFPKNSSLTLVTVSGRFVQNRATAEVEKKAELGEKPSPAPN